MAFRPLADDYNYVWNPLKQLDAAQQATARKTQADADIAYIDAGVIQVSQVQRNLQAAEAYQFDPDQIDELEELEDANMFKEPVTVEGEATEVEPSQGKAPAQSPGIPSQYRDRCVGRDARSGHIVKRCDERRTVERPARRCLAL